MLLGSGMENVLIAAIVAHCGPRGQNSSSGNYAVGAIPIGWGSMQRPSPVVGGAGSRDATDRDDV